MSLWILSSEVRNCISSLKLISRKPMTLLASLLLTIFSIYLVLVISRGVGLDSVCFLLILQSLLMVSRPRD